MPTRIKRKRCLLDLGRRCGCPRSQETCTNPLDEVVARDVIRPDDDHALTAAERDPVRGHRNGLSRACTCRVRLSVWPLRAYVLRKLRVAHAENLEEEAPIKVSLAEIAIAPHQLSELVVPWEGGREDDAGVCAHLLGQLPSRRHLLPLSSRVVCLNERNLGISKGLYTGREGELCRDVEGPNPAGINAVLLDEIEV